MIKKLYKKIIFSIVFLTGILFSAPVFAANILIDGQVSTLNQNQIFFVDVNIDPQGESINTIGGDVNFSNNLSFVSINDKDSIIGEWVEYPKLNQKTSSVHFSGIIPGGFSGYIDPFNPKTREPGALFRLYFKALNFGNVEISISNLHTYKNDGLGTEVDSSFSQKNILVLGSKKDSSNNFVDKEAPLPFYPAVVSDPLFYDGKYVVIFSAKDNGLGVDHYEVLEGDGSWEKTASPYLIKDQSLSSKIIVKAVDFAGNQQSEIVPLPVVSKKTYTGTLITFMIALAILCVIIVNRKWINKKSIIK